MRKIINKIVNAVLLLILPVWVGIVLGMNFYEGSWYIDSITLKLFNASIGFIMGFLGMVLLMMVIYCVFLGICDLLCKNEGEDKNDKSVDK